MLNSTTCLYKYPNRSLSLFKCFHLVGLGDDLVSSLEIAFLNLGDELGDANVNGAALNTLGVLALQAAARFLDGHFSGVTQSNFLEVAGTYHGILLGHGSLNQRVISHYSILLT